VARGLIYNTLAQIVFILTAMGIHFWLGRELGQATYGDVVVILSVATVTCLALKNGLRESTSRFIAAGSDNHTGVYLAAMKVQILLAVGITAIVFFGSDAIACELNDLSLSKYLKVIAFQAPAMGVYYLSYGLFNGRKQFGRQALLTAVHALLRITFVIALVLLGMKVAGVVWGTVAAAAGTGLLGLTITMRTRPKQRFPVWPIVRYALPIAVFFTSVALLMNIDILMLKRMQPTAAAVGEYGAARTFARVPFFLLTAFYGVLLPLVASAHAENNHKLVRRHISLAVRSLLMILLPVLALLSSSAEGIVVLFYGPRFSEAAAPLSVLCIGVGFLLLTVQLVTVLQATGRPRAGSFLMVALLPVDVALCAVLIPRYGTMGAALSTTLATGIGFVAAAGYICVVFKALPSLRSVANIMVSAVMVYLLGRSFPFHGALLLMLFVVAGVLYLVCLVLRGEFSAEDWRVLKSQIFSIGARNQAESVSDGGA